MANDKDAAKNKGGRPEKYKPEYAAQVYRLCLIGLKDTELADFFEVCEATLNTWKKDYPKFLESLKSGKANADGELVEKLYKRASGYSHKDEKIFCDKEGKIIRAKTTKHYPPDTTALIFWLKNRQGKNWKDRQEHSHEGNVTIHFDKADEDL